jgi:putative endonuclease
MRGHELNNREKGHQFELIAAAYLRNSLDYDILEMNYAKKTGEIDIIGREGNILCFIEVKYRKTSLYGSPEEAVSISKQLKIRKTAQFYLWEQDLPEDTEIRFDVVSILGNRIRLIRNAF